MPAAFVTLGLGTLATNVSAFWNLTQQFHAHLPGISAAGGAGYYTFSSAPVNYNGLQVLGLQGGFAFLNETRKDGIENVMKPLMADAGRYAAPGSTYNVTILPRISDWILGSLPGTADATGDISLVGSRMVSRDFLRAKDGPGRLTQALKDIVAASPGIGFIGHVVAGGAAAKTNVDSALNPAWRRTLTHIAFGVGWNSTTPLAEQNDIAARLTDEVRRLKALEPDMGTYLNEANANEQDFQKAFWGKNYKKLYKIKQTVDPNNLFIVRKGVGSENWDDDGLCRVTTGSARRLVLQK